MALVLLRIVVVLYNLEGKVLKGIHLHAVNCYSCGQPLFVPLHSFIFSWQKQFQLNTSNF